MRNGALIFPKHHAKVGHAHFGNAKRGEDLDAGGVAEDRKEIRHIGNDFVFGKVVFDQVLLVPAEAQRRFLKSRVHNFYGTNI